VILAEKAIPGNHSIHWFRSKKSQAASPISFGIIQMANILGRARHSVRAVTIKPVPNGRFSTFAADRGLPALPVC
jgi:hypothetical protein